LRDPAQRMASHASVCQLRLCNVVLGTWPRWRRR
jgi:hypothetical protein